MRTITIPAETGPPTCPPPPDGQRPYRLTVTDHGDGPEYTCTQQQDDDTTTLPPPYEPINAWCAPRFARSACLTAGGDVGVADLVFDWGEHAE